MKMICRTLRAERGVAMVSVILAIFMLTVVVAATAISTMGESTLSFDQLRGQQALAVAEAGAYRALAELRYRLTVDLEREISNSSTTDPSGTEADVRAICEQSGSPARSNVEIITGYAHPAGSSDWTRSGSLATLQIGTSVSPVQITDRSNPTTVFGTFNATIAVQPSGAAATCLYGSTSPEQEVMRFDFAIQSVGRVGNSTRTVCLRSSSADRCGDWFPSPNNWAGSGSGWPVVIEKASFSRWALMLLNVGSVWLFTGTTINGPVHSNTFIRIAGDPRLGDTVTQVDTNMTFYNNGAPSTIAIPSSDPNGTLRTATDNTTGTVFGSTVTGGASTINIPTNANPSRTSTGLSPSGANATATEIRSATSDLADSSAVVPDGAYVMDDCGSPNCGGIYIQGDVQQMALSSEGGMQVIRITTLGAPSPAQQNMKIIVNPLDRSVTTCSGFVGPDSTGNSCGGWATTRTYPADTFNGVIYVSGSITSDDANPGASSGLYGIVNASAKITIAAENEIRIADQLVYEAPPAGPGHNPSNVLGLYSVNGNVTIAGSLTPNDLYVDAVILAPNGRYWVDGWNTLTGKGNVYALGGSVQGTFGAFGGFSPLTGYGRVMTYDWRLRSNVSPPFFPLTEIYTAIRWDGTTTSAIWVNGDALYNRPEWEEMVGL
jgi:hypothetical protein